MFWRKQRAAIEGFHPLHRTLVEEKWFSVSLPRDQWEPVIRSLAGHEAAVKRRKWRITPRTSGVLVPMLRVLAADMPPEGMLSVALDTRGADVPEKRGPERPVQVSSAVASRRVGEVMSTMPLTVAPESDLAEAVALLVETQVKSLPVVSHDRLVGVLSRRDLVRALARQDDQIEAQVDELLRSATLECEVTVVDGVVQIGAADDPRVRAVARSLAGTVPGVVAIAFTE